MYVCQHMQNSILRWTIGEQVHSRLVSGHPHVCMNNQTRAGLFSSILVADPVLPVARAQQVAWLCTWLTLPLVSQSIFKIQKPGGAWQSDEESVSEQQRFGILPERYQIPRSLRKHWESCFSRAASRGHQGMVYRASWVRPP